MSYIILTSTLWRTWGIFTTEGNWNHSNAHILCTCALNIFSSCYATAVAFALTYLALGWHLAPRWCSLHHLCGRGWPLESPLLSLCTLCRAPNLKPFNRRRVTLPQLLVVQGMAVLLFSRCTPAAELMGICVTVLPHAPDDRNRSETLKPGH